MADCTNFVCQRITFGINVRIPLVVYNPPECLPPTEEELVQAAFDIKQELRKTYPVQVDAIQCPAGCRCAHLFDPIHQTVVAGRQDNGKVHIKNCEYSVVYEYDVEATIWNGLCKPSQS